jgi:hypothetical protein
MNNLFSIGLIAQSAMAILFLIHRFFKPLGSDLMFGVFVLSAVVGIYLLWQSFRNPNVQGLQKILGIILGILPLVFVIFMVYFVTNFTWHS